MANKKRLIYAEDALAGLQYIPLYNDVRDTTIEAALRIARSKIDNAPTVDAVEVVRCKDCKNWEDGYLGYCIKVHTAMEYDGFCSNGERKTEK